MIWLHTPHSSSLTKTNLSNQMCPFVKHQLHVPRIGVGEFLVLRRGELSPLLLRAAPRRVVGGVVVVDVAFRVGVVSVGVVR